MHAKTFHIESYGCSMNQADAEKITGFLESQGFIRGQCKSAELILLNTCAVKSQTEHKMLKRIKGLSLLAKKTGARLIVCGCLPKINLLPLKEIGVDYAGPGLENIASVLGLPEPDVLYVPQHSFSDYVSIIPISQGCVGHCSYCAVKNARGELRSFQSKYLVEKFKEAVSLGREVWLTAQDTGCYGFDIDSSLPSLLKKMLASSGEKCRIRIGMMNPQHMIKFYGRYIKLFEDERLYQFFHLPVQSGSDSVLEKMNRHYSSADAFEVCSGIRNDLPFASIATDLIVGFPGEKDSDFRETVSFVQNLQPDVLNISRFGARPGTEAFSLSNQLHGRVKKERSRKLALLHGKGSLARNRLFVGRREEIFVSEPGKNKTFVGRSQSYKPIVIKENLLGKFSFVHVDRAYSTYLTGRVV